MRGSRERTAGRAIRAVAGLVAAAAAGAGCGDRPAAPPFAATFGAGSRLKPTVLTVGDGVDLVEAWTDTQLGIRCAHAYGNGLDEDGVERCLPFGPNVLFTDPACTTAISGREDDPSLCPDTRQFAVLSTPISTSAACGIYGQRVYRFAAQIPTPARVYALTGDPAKPCVGTDTAGLTPVTYFALEAMPPSAFVAIARTTRERAPGIRADLWQGDDGAWEITGFFDESRGDACEGRHDVASDMRCVPTRRLYVGETRFVDTSCQMPAADDPSPFCDTGTAQITLKPAGMPACRPDEPLFEFHETVDTGTTGWGHVVLDDGTCIPLDDPAAPPQLYGVGPIISPASFPALQAREYGSGRVRLSFLGFGDKPFIPHGTYGGSRFFDSQAGRPCVPFSFPDGKVRCASEFRWVPLRANGYYAGPDCTGARIVDVGDSTSDPCADDPKVILVEGSMCDAIIPEVRALSRFTGTTLSVRDLYDVCTVVSVTDLARVPYLVGDPLDPATLFPEVERVQRN